MAKSIIDGIMYIIRSKNLRGVARTNAHRLCKETGKAFDGYSCLCTADMARAGVEQEMWDARSVKVAPLRYQGVNAHKVYAEALEAENAEGP